MPRLTFTICIAAILTTFFLPQHSMAQNGDVVDEIVAIVGDQIILQSEVDGMVANALRQQPQLTYSEQIWMEALNQIINQHVMAAAARQDTTIQVSSDQVEQALDRRIDQMIAQVGSQARLEELYGRSLVQIKAELRDDFRDQLLAEQLQQKHLRNVRITPTEVREWFMQFPTDSLPTIPDVVRLSHIVRYPEVTDEVKQRAREVISAIRDSIVVGGASFEEMARRFSEDPGSRTRGGRIEQTNLDDLVPEFAAVASRIPVGEVSQIFETPFGYHIVRVNERRGEIVDFNHILITIDDSQIDPEPTIEFLTSVRDSILNQSIPFEIMAKRHSQEELSAQLGGRVVDPVSGQRDLVVENLGPLWTATLDTMEVGEISKPARIELEDGRQAYHIVRLEAREAEHRVSLERDYERIEQFALQDKRSRWLQDWLTELRDRVYVELRGKAERIELARS